MVMAMLDDTVDFPTPPFPLRTMTTCLIFPRLSWSLKSPSLIIGFVMVVGMLIGVITVVNRGMIVIPFIRRKSGIWNCCSTVYNLRIMF